MLEQTSNGIVKRSLILTILLPLSLKYITAFSISWVNFKVSIGQFLLFIWCLFAYDWLVDGFLQTKYVTDKFT